MAKIDLDDVAGGYNRQRINNNFQEIEAELNNKVLYRDNPTGEPNQMENDFDMNNNDILNANDVNADRLILDGKIISAVEGLVDVDADEVNYDNTASGLTAVNVQDALDENASDIVERIQTISSISQLPPATGSSRKVSVTGYHAGTTVGGGEFVDAGLARHDGVINFDPTRSSEIGTQAYYTDSGADAACFTRKSVDIVTPYMAGAVANDPSGSSDAVIAAFSAAARLGVLATSYGVINLEKTVTWDVLNGFRFLGTEATNFIGLASFDAAGKMFLPTASISGASYHWEGGKIDGRLRPAGVGGTAPDLMYIAEENIQKCTVNGVYFLSNDDRTGTAGDSCLFLAAGKDYHVERNIFQGAVDAGLYISGDGTATKGERAFVVNNTFLECTDVGVISKRRFKEHIISQNVVERCGSGIVVGGEADGLPLGEFCIISNNIVKQCVSAIAIRNSDNSIVSANRIFDYGVNSSGNLVNGGAGIGVFGSNGVTVAGNHVAMSAATKATFTSGVVAAVRVGVRNSENANNTLISANQLETGIWGILENTGESDNLVVTPSNKVSDFNTPTQIRGSNSFTELVSQSGDTVTHEIDGTAATIDYEIKTKGSGRLRFGTHSATGDTPITGFIQIRDKDGNLRNLAVVS